MLKKIAVLITLFAFANSESRVHSHLAKKALTRNTAQSEDKVCSNANCSCVNCKCTEGHTCNCNDCNDKKCSECDKKCNDCNDKKRCGDCNDKK